MDYNTMVVVGTLLTVICAPVILVYAMKMLKGDNDWVVPVVLLLAFLGCCLYLYVKYIHR